MLNEFLTAVDAEGKNIFLILIYSVLILISRCKYMKSVFHLPVSLVNNRYLKKIRAWKMETFLNSLDVLLAVSEIAIQTFKVSGLMNYF